MRRVGPFLAALTLLAVLSAACSSSDAEPASPTTTATDADGESDPAPTTTLAADAADAADEPDAEAGLAADLEAVGVSTVELVTPEAGGGRRPLLEWEPVDEAVEYQVVLLTPSGDPYWGWITEETSVPVGGTPALDDGAAGPSVVAGMTWSVSAYGTDADLVGLSGHRSISP